jgi:uncharacterized oxidoreductase
VKLTGNTIFVTGGGSGIGRALAEALHKLGNQVIISGRRAGALKATTDANPGMQSVELDVTSVESIRAVAAKLITEHPKLNVLVNCAGIMKPDGVHGEVDDALVASIVTTNLLGPVRVTSAFIEHLKAQESATVINVSSGLAFVPLAMTAVYSATKAAIHSYTQSLRFLLKTSSVKVLELAPPYVQTELMGAEMAIDPRAMPLADFIDETMKVLGTDVDEILVERVMPLRNNPGANEAAFVNKFNDMMAGGH